MSDQTFGKASRKAWDQMELNSAPRRRHKAEPGECKFCDQMRDEGRDFHPDHDASRRCESGKRAHCSCDTCF